MSEDLDKILKDIEAEKEVRRKEEELARQMLQVDRQTQDRLKEERRSKVSGFRLELNLDDEPVSPAETAPAPVRPADAGDKAQATAGEASPAVPAPPAQAAAGVSASGEEAAAAREGLLPPEAEAADEQAPLPEEAKQAGEAGEPVAEGQRVRKPSGRKKAADPRAKTTWGCVRGILYAVLVLAASGILAYFVVAGVLDLTGLNKSDTKVPVTLTEEDCEDTGTVARILKEAGVIDQPLIFRLYCKLTQADGQFMPQDEVALSADMGYETIINVLKSNKREEIRLTFPEGMTVKEIAEKLEENNVCTVSEFYSAMESVYEEGSYPFLSEIPTGEDYDGRLEVLEGYIFPDTYDFYLESSGETVVKKFLSAFNNRVEKSVVGEDGDSTPTSIKAKAQGMTLDEVVILASIVQWEADNFEDMHKVAAVLRNRLNNPAVYPRLECDSTRRYINALYPPAAGQEVENLDYDTYKRNGLPVGPINNPGMDAIDAVLNPSEDMEGYYFFATAYNSDGSTTTYYSKTYAEHEQVCRRYGIGMYAE
ncbi:MAG TPA: endolytic transglycosylase MltG [Firmicutes bacterium]|nr:endolytic transglycosylase MltG [Bacillota bacterium]